MSRQGCPDEVIAARILHDTVEHNSITLDYIQDEFGDKVALIVEGTSESDKSLLWEDRKEHTIAFLIHIQTITISI